MTVTDPFRHRLVQRRGACAECGHPALLNSKGRPGFHREHRVKGFNEGGDPRVRECAHRCYGSNRRAEPLESEGAAA